MGKIIYAKDGKIYAKEHLEIHIPMDYFYKKQFATNKGSSIEALGLVYISSYSSNGDGEIQFLNIPTLVDFQLYDFEYEEIRVKEESMNVMTLKYLKDALIMLQIVQKGRHVSEAFLDAILKGQLPKTLDYPKIIDIWWRNLEMADVDFKVSSKILELIIANIYRSPNNFKQRFGEWYGKQTNPNPKKYETGDVRNVVEGLSTFSGMVFEDMGQMITSGINNSIEGVEEPASPLEKIIYY